MKTGDLVASKYRLIAKLGQGGMGSVWSAAHVQTEREFAIKFMHPMVASASEDARHRFVQEARASAKINHPNIIDIFDVGETEDASLYLVMELLDGMSLGDALRADPPFTARDLLVIIAGAVAALSAAHAAGVTHRDIKPPNIYLHRDRVTGQVRTKVVDFGVSKLTSDDGFATHTGSLLGSPRYMSPEQAISATAADGRADIWSLGVVLFEGLTGTFPHDGDSSNSLVIAIATRPPKSIHAVAPHLPLAVRVLVDECLRPVDQRIQTADALLEKLLQVLGSHDLRELALPRPANPKARLRQRAETFVIETDVDAIPGVSTTRSIGAKSRAQAPALSPRVPAPEPLPEPAAVAAPRPAAPLPPRLDVEDATLIHVPRASLSGADAPAPLAPAPLAPAPLAPQPTVAMALTGSTQTAPTPGLVPLPGGPRASSSALGADQTAKLTQADLAAMAVAGRASLPSNAALGAAHAGDTHTPSGMRSPFQAGAQGGGMFAAPTTDPGESISSINVVRGGDVYGGDQRFRSDPTQLRPARPKTGLIAVFGALGVVAVIAVGVIVAKSGGDDPAKSAAAAKPSAAAPVTTARDAATTTVAPPPTPATASASASSLASASASAKPAAGAAAAASVKPGGKVKRPTGDPVKDLGSGL